MISKRDKLSKKSSLIMLEKLTFYLDSHMPLDVALRSSIDTNNSKDKIISKNILYMIESGGSISSALNKYTRLPLAFITMIRGGEKSQNMNKSISTVIESINRQDDLKKKIISSMTYPAIIGLFALLMTIGLVRGILPQIIPMLKGLNIKLPFLTRTVIFVSDFISRYGLIIFGFAIIIITALIITNKKSKKFRYILHKNTLRIPILGRILILYDLAFIGISFSSMLESGISLVDSYSEIISISRNEFISRSLAQYKEEINNGVSVSVILTRFSFFPVDMISLINAGEKSGKISYAWKRCSESFNSELDHLLKRFTSLIEPTLMITMGIVIGSIALSIMLPIYEMSKSLQK